MGIGTLRRHPPYTLPEPVKTPEPPTFKDVPVTEDMQEEIERRLNKEKKTYPKFRK